MLLCICQYKIVTVRELSYWADLRSLDGGIMQVQLKKGVMDMLVLSVTNTK